MKNSDNALVSRKNCSCIQHTQKLLRTSIACSFFPRSVLLQYSLPKPRRCRGLVIKNLLRAEINGLGWWRRPLVHKQACIVRPYMQTRVRAYLHLRKHASLLCILSTYCGEGVRPSITAVKTLLYSGEGRPGPNTSVPPSDKVIWVPL